MKTRKARQRRAVMSIDDWCRRHRCLPIQAQHATLSKKLAGHYNYFAISGNNRSVEALDDRARFVWRKWLRRRSQRTRMTWERFNAYLDAHPLPKPTVRTTLWV
jgi:RNA-directed DNA polymerase